MIDTADTDRVVGTTAYDRDGDKIGRVGQLFFDDTSGRPEFVTVNTGLFGTKESFVPAAQAVLTEDRLELPFDKETVKEAPQVELDGAHLDESEERRLYEYYDMSYGEDAGLDASAEGTGGPVGPDDTAGTEPGTQGPAAGTAGTAGTADAAAGTSAGIEGTASEATADRAGTAGETRGEGHDVSGPSTDQAMTRSEEHLEAGTRSEQTGRARLRKYVTTETETVTVPVRKERAVLESEPVTAENADDAHDGPAISEEEHEVVLNEEKPVVETRAEPVERVRLGTESVTEEQEVSAEVRKEHIETEGDVEDRA